MRQDQVYIELIRSALWRRGRTSGAAVMVGAGFSRNATPASPGVRPFPTWLELMKVLVDQLYPDDAAATGNDSRGWWREQILNEINATSGLLRVAQEFAVFTRQPNLTSLLEREIADQEYRPSSLHDRLVSLPWSDVFTTNWDTLLERSAQRAVRGRYSVVHEPTDLPTRIAPRIVKLHGTLGVPGDLIFGEEDFRKYPADKAPFVNLVRQSMVEKVFCLIGFSANDPNFLNWLGWVRDQLGAAQHPAYLCGILDLSDSRKELLKQLNIIPIDLAHVLEPRTEGGLRHEAALDWLLSTFEEGKPSYLNFWPEPRGKTTKRTRAEWLLNPLPATDNTPLKPEPKRTGWEFASAAKEAALIISAGATPPEFPLGATDSVIPLTTSLAVWEHNRERYPGWLALPMPNRSEIWNLTKYSLDKNQWDHIILQPGEPAITRTDDPKALRLRMLRELAWRAELSLRPLPPGFVRIVEAALKVAGGGAAMQLVRQDLRFALLRHYRGLGNGAEFESVWQQLTPADRLDPDLRAAVCFERCLAALSLGSTDVASNELKKWPASTTDPFWRTRKAAMLAELGRVAEAYQEAIASLNDIQAATRGPAPSITLQSREAWTLLLAWHLCREVRTQVRRNQFVGPAPDAAELDRLIEEGEERLEDLAAIRCNTLAELDAVRGAMQGARSFDIPTVFDAAIQYILLVDFVGLPLTCGGREIVASDIVEAAKLIETTAPSRAVRLLLRAAPSLPTIKSFQVILNPLSLDLDFAALADLVHHINQVLENAHKHGARTMASAATDFERSSTARRSWDRFATAVYLLEALLPATAEAAAALPLDQRPDAEARMHKLIAKSTEIARAAFAEPALRNYAAARPVIAGLFSAIIASLPAGCLGVVILDLAEFPLPGRDLAGAGTEDLPEPLQHLAHVDPIAPAIAPAERIQTVTDGLRRTADHDGPIAAGHARTRLNLLERVFPPTHFGPFAEPSSRPTDIAADQAKPAATPSQEPT